MSYQYASDLWKRSVYLMLGSFSAPTNTSHIGATRRTNTQIRPSKLMRREVMEIFIGRLK